MKENKAFTISDWDLMFWINSLHAHPLFQIFEPKRPQVEVVCWQLSPATFTLHFQLQLTAQFKKLENASTFQINIWTEYLLILNTSKSISGPTEMKSLFRIEFEMYLKSRITPNTSISNFLFKNSETIIRKVRNYITHDVYNL